MGKIATITLASMFVMQSAPGLAQDSESDGCVTPCRVTVSIKV